MEENKLNESHQLQSTNQAQYSQQLSHISEVSYLEESSNIKLIFRGIAAVIFLIVALIIWSAFATINESTKALGQLIPEGELQVVQHLEGGIVQAVFVDDGDVIKRGQLLVQLKTNELEAELEGLYSNEISLILETERLAAFLQNKPPNPRAWSQKIITSEYNPVKDSSKVEDLIQNSVQLLEARYAQLKDIKAGLSNTLSQRKEKLAELLNKRKIWQEHMRLLEQEFAMYTKLKGTNYISGKDYLTTMRAVNQAKGEGAAIISDIAQTQEAIQESENKLKETDSTAREEALTQEAKAKTALLEVHYKIEKALGQIRRSKITAPVSGTVKDITVFPGNVIKPGSTLLDILPEGGQLIGESKVLPREIGYIKIGDPVQVKVMTYDYARFGSIKGRVSYISASTFIEQDGNTYYKIRIRLDKQYIKVNNQPKYLKAGMTIESDIITGSKTLLQYLLKPIHRSVTESFQER